MLAFGNRGQYHTLPSSAGCFPREARGVSADGHTIVGRATITSSLSSNSRAFYWRRDVGTVLLPQLGTSTFMQANDVSGDGSVIVGSAKVTTGGTLEHVVPWAWSAGSGLVALALPTPWDNSGLPVPQNDPSRKYSSGSANAVSDDGSIIVGSTTDRSADAAWHGSRWNGIGAGLVELTLPTELGSPFGTTGSDPCSAISGDGSKAGGWYEYYVAGVFRRNGIVWDLSAGTYQTISRPFGWANSSTMMVFTFNHDGSLALGWRDAGGTDGQLDISRGLDISRNGRTLYGHTTSTASLSNRLFQWDGTNTTVISEIGSNLSWRRGSNGAKRIVKNTTGVRFLKASSNGLVGVGARLATGVQDACRITMLAV